MARRKGLSSLWHIAKSDRWLDARHGGKRAEKSYGDYQKAGGKRSKSKLGLGE
jgi:hypothetical protein